MRELGCFVIKTKHLIFWLFSRVKSQKYFVHKGTFKLKLVLVPLRGAFDFGDLAMDIPNI